MWIREVFGQSGICVRPWHCPELKRRPVRQRPGYPRVIQPTQLMKFFPRYHERCQVRSVDSKEHHGKHGPHICHEAGSEPSW